MTTAEVFAIAEVARRKPYTAAVMAFGVTGGVALAIGVAILGGRYALPSLPCPDQACVDSDELMITIGFGLLGAGFALLLAAAAFQLRRSQLVFTPPPGWHLATGGASISRGWLPDPSWPAPPDNWQFWRRIPPSE